MSASKVLSTKNLFPGHPSAGKVIPASGNKENTDGGSKSPMKRNRPLTVQKDDPAGFPVFDEKGSLRDVGVQVGDGTAVQESNANARLVTADEPPPDYWKRLAEARRQALAEALEENEKLCEQMEEKDEEIADLKKECDRLRVKIDALAGEVSHLEELAKEAKEMAEMIEQYQRDDESDCQ